MKPDAPVCLCFHVTRRKIEQFIRIEKPKRPSQLSECFGAGTGCGWCIPYLERLLENASNPSSPTIADSPDPNEKPHLESISFEEYVLGREKYVRAGGGTPPPGATPIDPNSF